MIGISITAGQKGSRKWIVDALSLPASKTLAVVPRVAHLPTEDTDAFLPFVLL